MLNKVKHKIDVILEENKYSIEQKDYEKLRAYINLLYHFALTKNKGDYPND